MRVLFYFFMITNVIPYFFIPSKTNVSRKTSFRLSNTHDLLSISDINSVIIIIKTGIFNMIFYKER